MINEYLIIISDEIFRVYAPNEIIAKNTFQTACVKYMDTKNEDFKDYWNDLHNEVVKGNFSIMRNDDFIGVRKI